MPCFTRPPAVRSTLTACSMMAVITTCPCAALVTSSGMMVIPHFPYQPCRACRTQQQNYLM